MTGELRSPRESGPLRIEDGDLGNLNFTISVCTDGQGNGLQIVLVAIIDDTLVYVSCSLFSWEERGDVFAGLA